MSYCERFDLEKDIKLQHKVTNIQRSEDYSESGCWDVTVRHWMLFHQFFQLRTFCYWSHTIMLVSPMLYVSLCLLTGIFLVHLNLEQVCWIRIHGTEIFTYTLVVYPRCFGSCLLTFTTTALFSETWHNF